MRRTTAGSCGRNGWDGEIGETWLVLHGTDVILDANDDAYRYGFNGYVEFGGDGGLETFAIDYRNGFPGFIVAVDRNTSTPDDIWPIAQSVTDALDGLLVHGVAEMRQLLRQGRSKVDEIAFLERLAALNAELGDLLAEHRIDYEETLPHVYMADVSRWFVSQYEAKRIDSLRAVADWLENEYPAASPDVENLIDVSFLEMLPWPPDPDAKTIEGFLGPRLRKRLKDMQDWQPTT